MYSGDVTNRFSTVSRVPPCCRKLINPACPAGSDCRPRNRRYSWSTTRPSASFDSRMEAARRREAAKIVAADASERPAPRVDISIMRSIADNEDAERVVMKVIALHEDVEVVAIPLLGIQQNTGADATRINIVVQK